MELTINFTPGILTNIIVTPPEEVKILARNYLKSKVTKYDQRASDYFTYQVKVYDHYDKKTGIIAIPSGLVRSLLIDLLTDNFIEKSDIHITDTRQDFDGFDVTKINFDDYKKLYNYTKQIDVPLRDYQFEGVKALLSNRLGILSFPTSSGKGEVIVALATILQQYGQVLVLVPSNVSLISTKERLIDYGIKHYQYHKIRCLSMVDGVILSTPKVIYNDLAKKDNVLSTVKYLLTNEVHHVQATTWFDAVKGLPSVVRSYGFSATPDVSEATSITSIKDSQIRDSMIRGTHGDVIMEVKSRDIQKYLSVPEVINIIYSPQNISKKDYNSFDWTYVKKYIYELDRIEFISKLCHAIHNSSDFTTITFVSWIDLLGDKLFDLYPEKTCCWYGGGNIKTNVDGLILTNDSIFSAIKNKEIRHVVVTSHAREDINLPILNVAIMLDLAKEQTIKQCVGRVVRKGSPSFFVNIYDTGPKVLTVHARKRSNFIAEEYNVTPSKITSITEFEGYFLRQAKK